MVDLIDKAFVWMIVNAPSWKWTSFLMRCRNQWYSRWRKWDDDKQEWIKV